MDGQDDRETLHGDWYELPFTDYERLSTIAAIYGRLLEEHAPDDVLVLKRIPSALDALERAIRDECAIATRPRVESLPMYASRVVEIHDPDLDRLGYEQRIELLERVVARTDWESVVDGLSMDDRTYDWPQHEAPAQLVDFLETASRQESFGRDLGQLLLDVALQGGYRHRPSETTDPQHVLMAVVREVGRRFREAVDRAGYVERRRLIPTATETLLEDGTTRRAVQESFEAVLVVEFEECTPLDRRFLAALSSDADLAVVGGPHASIQRTKTESRSLDRVVAEHDLTPQSPPATEGREPSGPGPDGSTEPPHAGIPRFLATGETTDGESFAHYLEGEDADDAVSRVANEVEYLRERRGWEYGDFAVVLDGSGERLTRARHLLRVNDVPTRRVGMPSLREDPVVTELHALVQYVLNRDELAEEWLEARTGRDAAELVDTCVSRSVPTSLEKWIVNAELKERIVTGNSSLDAKEQFRNLERVASMATFVDETDLAGDDWSSFESVLDQALTFDAGYARELEVRPHEEGVTVTDVRGVKYDSFECVFLLDVIESRYPGDRTLTTLFPKPWLETMPTFPAVTRPTERRITETYPGVEGMDAVLTDPFDAYHRLRSRRKLALGARAATERLYFCSYEGTEGRLGRTHNDSRFLELLRDRDSTAIQTVSAPGDDGDGESRPLLTRHTIARRLLGEPWGELERVLRAAHTGEEVDLEDSEAVFGAIRSVLEDPDVDPVFAEAIRTQFDLARGTVIADG